jgi:phosphate-induced protein 1
MSQKIQTVALFAAIALAACSENPVDSSQQMRVPAFSPKSAQAATELPPLTLMEPEVFEPLTASEAVDHGGYSSKDNAPSSMGQDRPEHIKYWGGRVIPQQRVVSVYYAPGPIYSGGPAAGTTGTGAADGSLVGYYLRNVGGSPRWNVNTTYSQTIGKVESFVQNTMTYSGFWATQTGPTSGATVTGNQMVGLIEAGFASGKLTYDPSTLYVIFTGSGVNLGEGFSPTNLQYCAFHSAYRRNDGTFVQISAMPYDADFTRSHPSAAGSYCVVQDGAPNGDFAADAIVSPLQHETEETTTDPGIFFFGGWFDIHGFESSDKCAYIFGPVFQNALGSYNIHVGGKPFLVQGQWQRSASTPERCTTSL